MSAAATRFYPALPLRQKLLGTSRIPSYLRLFVAVLALIMLLALGGCSSGASPAAPATTVTTPAPTNSYYVSATSGSDTNLGTFSAPFATIQKCASTAQAGATCYVRAGVYYETVVPNSGITITNYNNEAVTIDGTAPVTGWSVYSGSIYKATVTMRSDDTNQVFVDQTMMTEARWPNGDDLFHPVFATLKSGTTDSLIVDPDLPSGNWIGARVHFWSGDDAWAPQTGTIKSSASNRLSFSVDGASYEQYIIPKAGGYYYLFGSLAALDTQREWFYDNGTSTLYFWAPKGVDPKTLNVRYKVRDLAFDLSGKSNVQITGINIFASTIKTDDASTGNVIKAVTAKYISHFTALRDNPNYPSSYWYAHMDDSGILIFGRNNTISDSDISYSAGNGVAVKGSGNTVKNNSIHHINYMANLEQSGVSIQGTDHKIVYNSIYYAARFGIVVGSITTYPYVAQTNNDISYNDVFQVMLLGRDGGGIYVAGYNDPPLNTGLKIHHNYFHDLQGIYPGPFLDSMTGIYFDENARGNTASQNVIWNTSSAGIFIHGGFNPGKASNDNIVSNNSIIDPKPESAIYLQDVQNCGSTAVSNNFVLVAPYQTLNGLPSSSSSSCPFSNNGPTAPGATEMASPQQVGCNLAVCPKSTPPAVVNGQVAASIAYQPFDITVDAGSPATFIVVGNGSGTLTYQWYRDGSAINGANSATYKLSKTSVSDNGAVFTVVVSNSIGHVTSVQAKLTVQ